MSAAELHRRELELDEARRMQDKYAKRIVAMTEERRELVAELVVERKQLEQERMAHDFLLTQHDKAWEQLVVERQRAKDAAESSANLYLEVKRQRDEAVKRAEQNAKDALEMTAAGLAAARERDEAVERAERAEADKEDFATIAVANQKRFERAVERAERLERGIETARREIEQRNDIRRSLYKVLGNVDMILSRALSAASTQEDK